MSQSLTIRDLFVAACTEFAERDAYRVVGGTTSLSYRDVASAAARLARRLEAAGVGSGDRVALLGESSPAWPTAYFAITACGAVVVPILPDFAGEDIGAILDHAQAHTVIISGRQRERVGADALGSRHVIPLEEVVAASDARDDDQPVDSHQWPTVQPEQVAAIIYTSGTTGHSKGVVLTHGNIASNVAAADTFAFIQPGESLLSVLPLAHTYECTLGMILPFSRGACVCYLDRPASPSVLAGALAEVRPHLMLAVPLLIEKLVRSRVFPKLRTGAARVLTRVPLVSRIILRAAGRKLVAAFGGRLRFFGIGGAPLAPDVERFLYRAGFPYAIGYGLTETSPLLAGTSVRTNKLGSTGVPIPGTEIRIVEGEIQARGPGVMRGYYRDPEQTASVLTEDGWFRTGDLGRFDSRGRLSVRGRLKTVILGPNGENIYPEAIESVINQYTPVAESLVLQHGRQIVARVRLDYETLVSRAGELLGSAGSAVHRTAGDAGQAMRKAAFGAGSAVARASESAGQMAESAQALAKRYLDRLRVEVNSRVSAFSRIDRIEEQTEPFEKTPTYKIKRYLYR